MSESDSISRKKEEKGLQDIRREIPAYSDPVYRLPLKPTEIPFQVIPRKHMELDIGTLGQAINMDFKEISPNQEVVI